ncbi:EamA family transporter [uncultured Pseudokineococcus sp.]|uniref:EamA family transporter n=1 Tax=uncultured Pseudokineococcus sp. TaxID=1642928 RepID=UPI00343B6D31
MTAATAVAPALWGTTYLVTTQALPPDRPLLSALLRALPAGVLLLLVARVLPRGAWWWRAGVLGLLNIGGFFALLFVAAYRLPGGVAAVVGALSPLVVALLAPRLVGERAAPVTLAAGVLGVAGVALLVLRSDAALDPVGLLAAAGGAVAMSLGVLLTKRWGRPVPLLAFTGWQLVAGGLLLAPLVLLVEGAPPALPPASVAGYAYLALAGTALAYALWFRGVAALPVTRVAVLGLVSPLVATAAGWLVLGESLGPLQLVGALVVVAALLLAQVRRRGRADPPAPVGGSAQTTGRSADRTTSSAASSTTSRSTSSRSRAALSRHSTGCSLPRNEPEPTSAPSSPSRATR